MTKAKAEVHEVILYGGAILTVKATGWVCTERGHAELFDGDKKIAEFSSQNWVSVLLKTARAV